MPRLFPTAALLFLAAMPALAAESAWVEIGPHSRLRLISTDVLDNGKTHAAIEIEMPEKTKTYWRIPGETGIPLSFETAGSQGVSSSQVLWPFPQREDAGGFVDYVYYGHTVLPVALEVTGAGTLSAQLFLGVCDEICVPVQATVELPLAFGEQDTSSSLRIRQALAEVPVAWDRQTPALGEPVFDSEKLTLTVPVVSNEIEPQSIIADTGDPADLFGMPQKSPESRVVVLPYLGAADAFAEKTDDFTFSFLTSRGAFSVKMPVALSRKPD